MQENLLLTLGALHFSTPTVDQPTTLYVHNFGGTSLQHTYCGSTYHIVHTQLSGHFTSAHLLWINLPHCTYTTLGALHFSTPTVDQPTTLYIHNFGGTSLQHTYCGSTYHIVHTQLWGHFTSAHLLWINLPHCTYTTFGHFTSAHLLWINLPHCTYTTLGALHFSTPTVDQPTILYIHNFRALHFSTPTVDQPTILYIHK